MATKTASESSPKKTTKKAAPKKAAPAAAAKKTAKKNTGATATGAKKTSAKKTSAKKTASKKPASKKGNYTKPDLREKIKDEVMAGDKGGRVGQWSARKAQLVAHEYEAQGGGYEGPPDEKQQHLKKWGDEKWHTKDGKKAVHGDTTSRYLPDKAWDELSEEEKKKTDKKKLEASAKGEQFVKNTPTAEAAAKRARTTKAKKAAKK